MSKASTSAEAEAAVQFAGNLRLVAKAIGLRTSKRQDQILEIMSEPGAWLAVRTCHGIGKTWVAAAIVCCFLPAFPGSMVVTTAPTASQVRDLLWMEVNRIYRSSVIPLGGDCKTVRWDIEPGWFAVGLSTRQPENMQGRHGGRMLFVLDEAAGVRPEIWLAIRSMTGGEDARCLAIGNPTRRTGDFASCFKDPRWKRMHINWREAPNITGEMRIPGGCTQAWVDDMARKFGVTSAIYMSRVEGEFPADDTDVIVPWSWIASAQEPERDLQALAHGPVRVGVDVARYGTNWSIICVRQGARVIDRERYQKMSIPELARRVALVAERHQVEPGNIAVDDTGVGGGVVDLLNEACFPARVRAFNFGGKADDENHYADAATEVYWRLRLALDPEGVMPLALPEDDTLADDLQRRYNLTDKGKMKVESKDEFAKRNPAGRSPDDGDALVLTYATPEPAPADYRQPWGDDKADSRASAAIAATFSDRAGNGEDEDETEEESEDGGTD